MFSQIIRSRFAVAPTVRGLHASAICRAYPVGKTGKPLVPFMRFGKEKRPEVLKQHPNFTVPEVGKELGRLWKELSEAERQRYKDEYTKAKGQ